MFPSNLRPVESPEFGKNGAELCRFSFQAAFKSFTLFGWPHVAPEVCQAVIKRRMALDASDHGVPFRLKARL